MDAIDLPSLVEPLNPFSWPQVCLADVWQPEGIRKGKVGFRPAYKRRLFAAQDWETIWPRVNRCSLHFYNRRPAAITRYRTSGAQLPLVLNTVALGMAVPRLYALDGILKPHKFEGEQPRGALPLLGRSGTWVGRHWPAIRSIWQQQDTDSLCGLGLIALGDDRVALQPISHNSMCTDRHVWALNVAEETNPLNHTLDAFMNAPVLSEAQLVACAIKPFQAHYRLNRGIVEKLRLQSHKDPLAPKTPIAGQTTDYHRPHYDWLVVLQPRQAILAC